LTPAYLIWWGQAPKIMYTLIENCNLAGKTVIPFCTSASSGIGTSATNLQASDGQPGSLACREAVFREFAKVRCGKLDCRTWAI